MSHMQTALSEKAFTRLKNIALSELIGENTPVTQLNDLLNDAELLRNAAFVAAVLDGITSDSTNAAVRIEVAPAYYFADPSATDCHLVCITDDIRLAEKQRRYFTFNWSGHPAVRWVKPLSGQALLLARHAYEAKQRETSQQKQAACDYDAFEKALWARAWTYCEQHKPGFTDDQLSDLADFFKLSHTPSFRRNLRNCAWLCNIMGITLFQLLPDQ